MTYFERVAELRDNTNLTVENYEFNYLTAELVLCDLLSEYISGAEIISTTYGTGKVVSTSGETLDQMSMEVAFTEVTKRFGVLPVITGKVIFTKFADISEIGDAWDHAFDLHTDLTRKLNEFKMSERQQAFEAKKQAEADKVAEKKYQHTKDKAIKDFEALAETDRPIEVTNEFYYSLGWLAKHVGAITAKLPDYLSDAFKRHFGADTVHNAVDSKKKTVNGNSMQWTFGFTATLRKPENIPAALTDHLSSTGNKIADTSFIWDLVDNYGFQFGKTQDVDKIKSHVPADCLASFEAGMA